MSEEQEYVPPKVWTWDMESGGRFAKINRPEAGPTHDKELPVGEHPLQLYSLATPNGVKVTVMLEELLKGLPVYINVFNLITSTKSIRIIKRIKIGNERKNILFLICICLIDTKLHKLNFVQKY